VLCIAPTGRSASLFERKAASRRRLGAVAGYLGFGGRTR
jgi:hypothetical protein